MIVVSFCVLLFFGGRLEVRRWSVGEYLDAAVCKGPPLIQTAEINGIIGLVKARHKAQCDFF